MLLLFAETKYDKNGYVIRNRYTPEHVTISDRKSQVLLEYNPSRVLYAWPNSIKERDIVYKELGLDFEF